MACILSFFLWYFFLLGSALPAGFDAPFGSGTCPGAGDPDGPATALWEGA